MVKKPDGTAQQGEPMPRGLIPADLELLWLGQLLFGTAPVLEHPYRV